MEREGRRPEPGELAHFNFMTRRIEAFDRNEVDPDNLKRIIDDLMSTRIQWGNLSLSDNERKRENEKRAKRFN